MKTIAVIEADFERSPLGLPSRLDRPLAGGETVLRRTLRQVCSAARPASVHLVVHASQETTARSAVEGFDVMVETHDTQPTPWRDYIAHARKWSLDSWRGGLGGATVFDEFLHPWVADALARREQADSILSLPASAPLIDPDLIDAIVAHFEEVRERVRVAFTQSAPGLSGIVYQAEFVRDLCQAMHPPGKVMAYRPAEPAKDMTMQSCFYPASSVITHAKGRCLVDTEASHQRVESILTELGDDRSPPDAEAVSRWLHAHRLDPPAGLPVEVEIELTTEDPLPRSKLRPRGEAVNARGPMDESLFRRLVDELAQRDDVRIVLGGYGDPLMHPHWDRLVRHCREAGVFGLAIRSPAVHLDEQGARVLVDNGVDVLNVLLDAHSPGTYRQLHQEDHYDRVLANLDRLFAVIAETSIPCPFVVPEMIKTADTLDEIETFYDHWMNRVGSALITSSSHHARRWPDLSVMQMSPPSRFPCQRVFERAMILADGRMTACDQDFNAESVIGSTTDTSLADLWMSDAMARIRDAHQAGRYDPARLCPDCQEWHRP